MSADELCYVAICPVCQGWQAVTVVTPERQRTNARHVGNWIRAGLRLETWTTDRFRREAKLCQCLKNRQRKTKDRQQSLIQ